MSTGSAARRKSRLSKASKFGGTPADMAIVPPRSVVDAPDPDEEPEPRVMDKVIPTRRSRRRSREDMLRKDLALRPNNTTPESGEDPLDDDEVMALGRVTPGPRGRNPLAPQSASDTTTNPTGTNPSPNSALPR